MGKGSGNLPRDPCLYPAEIKRVMHDACTDLVISRTRSEVARDCSHTFRSSLRSTSHKLLHLAPTVQNFAVHHAVHVAFPDQLIPVPAAPRRRAHTHPRLPQRAAPQTQQRASARPASALLRAQPPHPLLPQLLGLGRYGPFRWRRSAGSSRRGLGSSSTRRAGFSIPATRPCGG